MTSLLLEQFPRFSEYDPGASGEGSLDPLGLGAVADRIADKLAPGLRARMAQPRFVTLAAVGATACQQISDIACVDGKSTFDLAFEWLLVESLVQNPVPERLRGVPGSQKAQRAARTKERLSAANYLSGPRVFGFTGVYRPFSLDASVLSKDGLPAENAEPLVRAWEQDQGLSGFLAGLPGSEGLRLRREIETECLATLRAGHTKAPPTGWLMKQLADSLAPREAKRRERRVLRELISSSAHEVRNELTALLSELKPAAGASQVELAQVLVTRASPVAATVVRAAIDFETCATAIEYSFRRFLAYASSLGGAVSVDQAADAPQLGEVGARLAKLTKRAVSSVAALDEGLAHDVVDSFRLFEESLTAPAFVEALIERHQIVQDTKGKRMWLDPLKGRWVVRPAYRNQQSDLDDELWTHPMRLQTLATFLRATS